MAEADEIAVLLALSAQIKKNGWFPTRQAFIKRETRPALDALIQSKTVRVDSNGQLVPKGTLSLRDASCGPDASRDVACHRARLRRRTLHSRRGRRLA